ncbi:uncharacterized protein LOC127705183 isoform X13 [Mytilus californianus]|uniref:uncharacterized protein LOC127705183 isoform X13 n=1 Tax=Mytilus californianus TaxID=6549 RepID=UPI0022454D4E|nr:uncharacterized protein LOC127705183 isoform X13 [Mytilus californianus]
MNQYQKVYMNQIHSSSLLGQLAQMWKSQMLCDALIRTGNVTTKAHRVVLVAACPMLQSMDNASVGSHLEVRLAADIKQEAVNSFLQYLYEGFMMLSEENCKDVEKVARLLQVDSVTKCCIDFYNCLQKKTGVPVYSNTQYKYSSADLLEFRHVRTTDLQKTLHERMMKRAAADSVRPTSPSGKRQRMQQQRPPSPNIDLAMFGQKADDTLSMAHSYMGNIGNQAAAEPWERVPRIGAIHSQRQSHPKPGVIEIVEDSLEILQTQPPDKDGNKSAPPIIQKSLAISVSSQVNSSTDVHVVNVNDSSSHPTAAGDGPIMSTGRDSITVSPLTVMPGTSSLSSSSTSSPLTKDPHKSAMDKDMSDKQPYAKKLQSSLDHQSSTPQRGLFPVSISPANMSPINQVKKSFAAGSASQAASMSQSHDSPAKRTPTSAVNEMERPPSSDSGKDLGTKSKVDDRSALNSTDMAPDLSIVKVEPTGEAGLDMYVDVPEESMIQAQQREQREHDDESDLELEEASGDWSRDEMSNEAAGGDQNNSWYIGQFKGQEIPITEGFEKLRQKKYNPKTRPTVELADYYEVGEDNVIRDGYCILAPGAKIAVNEIWLYGILSTISKKRDRRKAPKEKEKAGFEILKRLIDGFYEPWDLAIDGGTKVFHDSKIFRALRSYAEHKLEMDQITFNRGWLEKMSSAKKTVKRLNKLAIESEKQ